MKYSSSLLDKYLDAPETQKMSPALRNNAKLYIPLACEFMNERGYDIPDEDICAELWASLEEKYASSVMTKKVKPAIKKFFEWTAKREGRKITKEEEVQLQIVIPAMQKPDAESEQSRIKRSGRPSLKDPVTGEDYRRKVTIYLSPSLEADVKMLAQSQGTNINGYIRGLVIADRNAKKDRLAEVQGIKAQYEKSKTAYLEALRNL